MKDSVYTMKNLTASKICPKSQDPKYFYLCKTFSSIWISFIMLRHIWLVGDNEYLTLEETFSFTPFVTQSCLRETTSSILKQVLSFSALHTSSQSMQKWAGVVKIRHFYLRSTLMGMPSPTRLSKLLVLVTHLLVHILTHGMLVVSTCC